MSLPAPEPFSSAGLDRSLLHLFVYGPGFGEGLAVALPGQGWVVVDGCARGDRRPLVDLLVAHPGEPIDAVILTHPHDDHAGGLLEFLTHPDLGPRIRKVGCVARHVTGTPDNTLGAELDARRRVLDPLDPAQLEAYGGLKQLLERLRTEWEDSPERRLPLVDGVAIPLSTPKAGMKALAPTGDEVTGFFADADLPGRLKTRANDLSIVMQLEYGETTLLLGGDLPRTKNGVDVPSGWVGVAGRHDSLDVHAGLKVPHHASREALGDELLGRSPAGRAWIVAPWNSNRGLPRFDAGHGAHALLAVEPEFMLTGLPVSIERQQPQPERQSIVGMHAAVAAMKNRSRLLAGAAPANDPTVDPAECVWLLSFDDQGRLVRRGRGPRALVVVA